MIVHLTTNERAHVTIRVADGLNRPSPTALRRQVLEQSQANRARAAMWRRLSDAIAAPPGAKPPADHFSDGSLLELRMESLEAYALGDGCYSLVGHRDKTQPGRLTGTDRPPPDLCIIYLLSSLSLTPSLPFYQ